MATEGGEGEEGGDYASVGGTTVGSVRAWLRHLREFLYQTFGLLPTHCPAALDCAPAAAVFAPAVFSYVEVRSCHISAAVRAVAAAAPAAPARVWRVEQRAAVSPPVWHWSFESHGSLATTAQ